MDEYILPILAVSLFSLGLNAIYILHEIGWFPHGKPRNKPIIEQIALPLPTPMREKEQKITLEYSNQNSYALKLRRYIQKDFFEYDNPVNKLQNVIDTFKRERTLSHFEDLVNITNIITINEEPSEELVALKEYAMDLIQEYEIPKIRRET